MCAMFHILFGRLDFTGTYSTWQKPLLIKMCAMWNRKQEAWKQKAWNRKLGTWNADSTIAIMCAWFYVFSKYGRLCVFWTFYRFYVHFMFDTSHYLILYICVLHLFATLSVFLFSLDKYKSGMIIFVWQKNTCSILLLSSLLHNLNIRLKFILRCLWAAILLYLLPVKTY